MTTAKRKRELWATDPEYREREIERKRAYRASHPGASKATWRKHYETHREEILAAGRARREQIRLTTPPPERTPPCPRTPARLTDEQKERYRIAAREQYHKQYKHTHPYVRKTPRVLPLTDPRVWNNRRKSFADMTIESSYLRRAEDEYRARLDLCKRKKATS